MKTELEIVRQKLVTAEQLLGTWKLLSWTYKDELGQHRDYFGKAPGGILMYDRNGYMNAQLTRSNRAPFGSDDLAGCTPAEAKTALDSYLSYYGRYRFDARRQLVIHSVEASLNPNWIGQEQVRYVRLEGNHLFIITPPFLYKGQTVEFSLEWEKL
jgi:hypothetical protein